MEKLIDNFSIKSVADFFFNKISSFQKIAENFDYILTDKDFELFSNLEKVGEAKFKDESDLLVFTCKFSGLLSERSSKKRQFEIAKKILKEDFKDGAIFIFYDDNDCFRFSFIRKNYGNKDQKFTNWKRYTYFVDPAKTNKTFKDRIGKSNFSSLEDIQEAFNVEKLTKQFYTELFDWYQWALSEKDGFEVTFPNDISTDTDDRRIEEHLIRLITRLMFVWFIKKKNLIPNEIFDVNFLNNILVDFDSDSKTNGNYYNAILQNLFFASLNKPIDERTFATDKSHNGKNEHYGIKTLFRDNKTKSWFKKEQSEIVDLFNSVPFLNGGLFECLDKENDNGKIFYYDGFSRIEGRQKRAFLPNCIFFDAKKGIIPLLERYNFTIEENAVDDIEVALDPELLGKVFENLLGAYNPETKETARKQSGSFYTPREIVDYMVQESIIQYLKKECPKIEESVLHELFSKEELPKTLTETDCIKIATSLRKIKILDPACGSGAFPMGVLNALYKVIKKIDTKNALSSYTIKLELIENCIFGVDIQSIAVQISKLRFFIALVVEQEATTDSKENYGIKSLPNLETKFVAANTLIGLKQESKTMIEWQDETLRALKNQLWDIRCHQNFRAQKWQDKKTLRQQDKKLCNDIETYLKSIASNPNIVLIEEFEKQIAKQELEIESLPVVWIDETDTAQQTEMFENAKKTESIFKIDINKEKRDQLKKSNKLLLKKIELETNKKHLADTAEVDTLIKWNPYDQNTSSPFFDPEWMFGVKEFDVVIGNPPYVSLSKIKENYKNQNFKSFEKTTDLYCLFYEKSNELLRLNCTLCLITSNQWLQTNYGKILRDYFVKNLNPIKLINFGGLKVFESATVDTNIFISNKEKCKNELKAAHFKNDFNLSMSINEYFEENKFTLTKLDNEKWIITSDFNLELKNKIIHNSKILKKWNVEINRGLLTGLNEAFIINNLTKNELVRKTPESIEIIKPILRGRDTHKYSKVWGDLWLIVTKNGIDIKKYKSVYEHLESFGDRIKNRGDKGKYWWNLRACSYYDDFQKPKIIYPETTVRRSEFFIDNEGFYIDKTCFMITGENLEYINAILCSKLVEWYLESELRLLGKNSIQYSKQFIELAPIRELQIMEQQPFIELVNQILSAKKDNIDTTDLEAKIDLMVYKLYELTYEEVLVVEPGFSLSEQEYDNFAI